MRIYKGTPEHMPPVTSNHGGYLPEQEAVTL